MLRTLITSLTLLLCTSITLYAEEGSGSCLIQGSAKEYVEGTAYITSKPGGFVGGKVVISNSSLTPLMSYTLTVKGDVLNGNWQNVTFYSGTCHEKCDSYQSKTIDLNDVRGHDVRNITVTISNPVCM